MKDNSILLTGAGGNVTQAIIRNLPEELLSKVILTSRNAHTLGNKIRIFDFEKQETFASALEGIDLVFLLRPPHLSDVKKYFLPFILACKKVEVKHIIFLSVQGVETSNIIPHAKIEKLIIESGIKYTFIRPSYFMQNLTTTLNNDISKNHEIFLPAGNAPFLWIDVDNIGEAIASIIKNYAQHENKVYIITGKELLNFQQVADMISKKTGTEIKYKSPLLISFYLKKRKDGMLPGLALIMILLHYLPRFQKAPVISKDFTTLTGKEPTTLSDFIDRNKESWKL